MLLSQLIIFKAERNTHVYCTGGSRYWHCVHCSFVHRSHLTPYAKQNGGKYDFIVEDQIALPQDEVILIIIHWK